MTFKISSNYFISLAVKLQLSVEASFFSVWCLPYLPFAGMDAKLKLIFDKVVQDIIVSLNVITKCFHGTPYLVLWVL